MPMWAAQALAGAALALSLLHLGVGAGRTILAALATGGRRDDALDDDAFAASRFALPVSIVIPLGSNESAGMDAIACALASAYPEFEVIVVADGDEGGLADIKARWQLEPHEFFYRQVLPTAGDVRRILRSASDPRLLLVEKGAGGAADAVNCGINLAQYRYVLPVEPTMRFAPDALMRALSPALRDPDLVAVATHVECLRKSPSSAAVSQWSERFQRLESIRALTQTRIGRSVRQLSCSREVVVAWRRDALLDEGGYPVNAVDPARELLREMDPVVTQGDVFGHFAPIGFGAARQRAAIEARAGTAAQVSVALAVVSAFALVATGAATWADLVLVLMLLGFGQALVTTGALLVRGAVPGAPSGRELARLILVSPFELVLYRMPLALGALTAGTRDRRTDV